MESESPSIDPRYRPEFQRGYSGTTAPIPLAQTSPADAPIRVGLPAADVPVADLLMADLPVADLPVADLPMADLPVADLPPRAGEDRKSTRLNSSHS